MKKIISHSLSFLAGFLSSSYIQYKTKPVANSIIRSYSYGRSDDDLKAVFLLGLGTFKAFILELAYLDNLTYDEMAPLPEEDDGNSLESFFSDKILTEDDARHHLEKKGTKFGFSKKNCPILIFCRLLK